MLFVNIFKYVTFCSLVASRPLQTEESHKTQRLSRRARPYSVVPVDGSADRTSSSISIKTTVLTKVETATTTKIMTVSDDPVTQTVLLIMSASSSQSDSYQPTLDVNSDHLSLPGHGQPTPMSTTNRKAPYSPSETLNKERSSPSPTSTTAVTAAQREEQSDQADHMYLYPYRWSNSTSSIHEGSAYSVNDDAPTTSSY